MSVLHAHQITYACRVTVHHFKQYPHGFKPDVIPFGRCSQQRHGVLTECATEGAPGLSTPVVPSIKDVMEDSRWISGIISIWLNEEWTELDIHKDVGSAAGRAYVDARNKGTEDMGDLVLELSSQLTSFDFDETFVGPFDVANKVVEFLMLRDGIDVCCTSDDDLSLLRKYSQEFQS